VSADGPVDAEELELAALSEAARASLRLMAAMSAETADEARRVVVALELPEASVAVADDGPEDPPGRVRLAVDVVPLARVAALHVDEEGVAGSGAAAAAVVAAADDGDAAAEAVVAALDEHDLLWYDPAELPALVRPD
jgi:hypothetical protein